MAELTRAKRPENDQLEATLAQQNPGLSAAGAQRPQPSKPSLDELLAAEEAVELRYTQEDLSSLMPWGDIGEFKARAVERFRETENETEQQTAGVAG